MIEVKIPLTDLLNDRLFYGVSIMDHIVGIALQTKYVDSTIYNIMKPNLIASDGYIIVQFMEQKNV